MSFLLQREMKKEKYMRKQELFDGTTPCDHHDAR